MGCGTYTAGIVDSIGTRAHCFGMIIANLKRDHEFVLIDTAFKNCARATGGGEWGCLRQCMHTACKVTWYIIIHGSKNRQINCKIKHHYKSIPPHQIFADKLCRLVLFVARTSRLAFSGNQLKQPSVYLRQINNVT